MSVISIYSYPEPSLRKKSNELTLPLPGKDYAIEFINVMRKANGIGLASRQVGDDRPFIAVTRNPEKGNDEVEFAINPRILKVSRDLQIQEEGCLSLPGIWGLVRRPEEVYVSFTTLDGSKKKIRAQGLEAACWLHEIDHLEGVLFIDRAFKITRGVDLISSSHGFKL